MTTPVRIGPYRIEAELGRGGMAVVYRAVDTRTQATVALKVLPPHLAADPRYLPRFEREGHSAARLNHPHIVRVLGTGSDGGYHYLALQFVDGQTLTEYMRDRKSLLPAERITAIINQLAAALDYAHEMGVLHRDIKNGNIMLDKTGAALLTDFGVAKLEDEEFANYTVVGTTVGTPAFMAPEQARGAPVDRRADVYSLGVVAYTLFTGTAPFKADSQPALLHKVVYEPPQPPEEVNSRIPPGVVYVLKKVLSKSPSGRYPTAGAFATALAKGLTWAPTSGEMKAVQDRMLATSASQAQVAVVPPVRKRGSAGPWIGALLGIGGLATAAFLYLNPPAGLGDALGLPRNDTLSNPALAQPLTLSFERFAPEDGAFALSVPTGWNRSESTFDGQPFFTFDAPDRLARVFAVRLPPGDGEQAGQALARFWSGGEQALTAVTAITDEAPVAQGAYQFVQQTALARWQGQPVKVQLSALAGSQGIYLVGLIVDEVQADLFGEVRTALVQSFEVDLAPVAAATPSATPAPVLTGEPLPGIEVIVAEDAVTATTMPAEEPSATPVPTEEPPAPATSTALTAGEPAAGETPLVPKATSTAAAATGEPVVTPTAEETGATETPSSASPPAPAGESLPLPTVTPAPATATAAPPATATPSATVPAPPTPTATSSPNATTTAAVAENMVNTAVAQTLTAMPTATDTPTPRPSSTPIPTQTATNMPSATPTVTPSATLVPSSTPLPTGTPSATPTPSSTPQPTSTRLPTGTPDINMTLTVISVQLTEMAAPPTPTRNAVAATLTAVSIQLTELASTPTPTQQPAMATMTAISVELTRLAGTPTP
jgi:serine/threonine protein kinase